MSVVAPQNVEAEESVLGATLISKNAIEAVLPILEPAMFYREAHALIYACVRDMYAAGVEVDAITLADSLGHRLVERGGSELDEVGGTARVHELAALVPASANAGFYAEIVREKWKQREISRAMVEAQRAADEDIQDADDTLTALERTVLDLRERIDRGKRTVIPIRDAIAWFAEKTENPLDEIPGVSGPFRCLRKFVPSRLTVLGGYPADGKTIVAIQAAKSAAKGPSLDLRRKRGRVGIVTLEMSWEDLIDRMVTTYGVPYRQVQTGRVHGIARDAAVRAITELRDLDVDLIDDESADAAAIWRYQRLGRYDFLIVDHLHQIAYDDRRELEQEVSAIARLARREEIPILLLSQLSRGGRDAPRPTLASFRESGVIEQVAALACAIYRTRDLQGKPTNEAEFIVLKNRFGKVDSYPLTFKPMEVRYEEPGQPTGEQQTI